MTEQVAYYTMNFQSNPLSASSENEVSQLAQFIDRQNQRVEPGCVILHLTEGDHFINGDFIGELRRKALYRDVFGRMLRLWFIGQKIKHSKHLWAFCFAGDCFGALFDLALCCDFRFCFSSMARVGFPSLKGGFFPFVGPFIERYGRSSRRKTLWARRGILKADDAATANLLDYATDHTRWQGMIERLLLNRLERMPAKQSDQILDAPVFDTWLASAANYLEGHPDIAKARPGKELYEASWEVASRVKGSAEQELMATIVHLGARTLVSREYLLWAERYLALGGKVHWLDHKRFKSVYVDLDHLAPPIQPLQRLIDSGYKIIFCSPDAGRLKEGIDLMFARFERNFPKPEVHRSWHSGICWYTGDIQAVQNHPVVCWQPNDRVDIRTGDGALTFLRFLGNRGSAKCGWSELSLEKLDHLEGFHQSYEIARIMSDGIVKTMKVAEGKLELSTVIRSLFLEELVRIGNRLHGATGKLLPSLKEAGWGYIAEDNSWEYFLRSREGSFGINAYKVRIGQLRASPEMWAFGMWREAREWAKRSTKEERLTWNLAYLSRHFATFAGLMARAVLEDGLVRNRVEADRLVYAALGFPAGLGTPLSFVRELGERRFQYYCKRYWLYDS